MQGGNLKFLALFVRFVVFLAMQSYLICHVGTTLLNHVFQLDGQVRSDVNYKTGFTLLASHWEFLRCGFRKDVFGDCGLKI